MINIVEYKKRVDACIETWKKVNGIVEEREAKATSLCDLLHKRIREIHSAGQSVPKQLFAVSNKAHEVLRKLSDMSCILIDNDPNAMRRLMFDVEGHNKCKKWTVDENNDAYFVQGMNEAHERDRQYLLNVLNRVEKDFQKVVVLLDETVINFEIPNKLQAPQTDKAHLTEEEIAAAEDGLTVEELREVQKAKKQKAQQKAKKQKTEEKKQTFFARMKTFLTDTVTAAKNVIVNVAKKVIDTAIDLKEKFFAKMKSLLVPKVAH